MQKRWYLSESCSFALHISQMIDYRQYLLVSIDNSYFLFESALVFVHADFKSILKNLHEALIS